MPIAVPHEVELAWKVAGLLPYFEAEPSVESRSVAMGNRSQQVIPPEAFGPKVYHWDAPQITRADGTTEAVSVNRWLLNSDLAHWWKEDIVMRAALVRNLGKQGVLTYIHTLHEMQRISIGRGATELWYAARFGIAEQGSVPKTIISLCDNGMTYQNAAKIEEFWTADGLWHPAEPRMVLSAWGLVPASVVRPAVTGMFKGMLTVMSGSNRLDFWQDRVRRSKVTPRVHNLMFVTLPHVVPRPEVVESAEQPIQEDNVAADMFLTDQTMSFPGNLRER